MMIILALALWRIGLFLVAYKTMNATSFVPQFPYSDIHLIPSQLPQWVWGFANFDGVHYLTIAKQGYFAQFTQAFFPVYPLLIHVVSWMLHDKFMILSGILISFVSFILLVYVFKLLFMMDYPKEKNALNRVILLLLLFPTSFYFASLYTESFFLFLTLAAFYNARKGKWIWAAVCGAVASATRITGIVLLLPLLLEWHITTAHVKEITLQGFMKRSNIKKFLRSMIRSPILYIVPLGLCAYMIYLQFAFHDALYFWHAQPVFGAERSSGIVFPLQVVWRYLKIMATVPWSQSSYWVAFWELGALIVATSLLIWGHLKKIRFSYLVFGWLVLLTPILTGTLSSLPRYILLIFPLYMVLGKIKNRWIFLSIIFGSSLLLIYFTSRFVQGLWVA